VIIVDTTVAFELMGTFPAQAVQDWVRSCGARDLFTTSITLAEIRYGIERLPAGRRKELLRATAMAVFAAFADQVLAFDARAALRYAAIVGHRDRAGLPIDGFDAQIAAICRTYDAALATSNPEGFQHTGIELINPWQPA
jgi:toxin FitB